MVESFVADNKTFCVYLAKDETIINEHARNQRLSCDQNHRSQKTDRSDHGRRLRAEP